MRLTSSFFLHSNARRLPASLTFLAALPIALSAACGGQLDPGSAAPPPPANSPANGDATTIPPPPSVGDAGPSSNGTCTVLVPSPVVPIAPTRDAATTCATSTPPPPIDVDAGVQPVSPSTDTIRTTLVGRWFTCAALASSGPGFEFGGNGRYRTLTRNTDGSVTTVTTGRYTVLYSQVNLDVDDGNSSRIYSPQFPGGTDWVTLDDGQAGVAAFVRVPALAANGADNPPPLRDGACTMAGTWDAVSKNPNDGSTETATIVFDALGNFMGGDKGSDVCSATFHGTYDLAPGKFEIIQADGMGCPYDSLWRPAFDATCTKVIVTGFGDNCTGSRKFISYDGTLTRRP